MQQGPSLLRVRALDIISDDLAHLSAADRLFGEYNKVYLCIKGDLSDYIVKSPEEILNYVAEIAGVKEKTSLQEAKKKLSSAQQMPEKVNALQFLGSTQEAGIHDDIEHGRDASQWCVDKYAAQFVPGDMISVVRNRDEYGMRDYKVSYVGKVVMDRAGNLKVRKVPSFWWSTFNRPV